jgi:hypothetical protein
MYGRATLAMLVSSTSMKAAIATITAIAQGLNLGLHGSDAAGAAGGRSLDPASTPASASSTMSALSW